MKLKLIVITLTIIGLIGQNVILVNPVRASIPVIETNVQLLADNTGSFIQQLYEWAQTFVVSSLKKRVLDMLVDQIIQFVQGGGKPRFITDWQGFLSDAASAAAGDAAQLAGLGFLCSPFNLQVQLLLAPVPKFTQQISCTLDQIVENIQGFYNDFRSGSWIAYGEMLKPQNNFYTATLIAESAQNHAAARASAAAFSEGISGNGFFSLKQCDENGRNCVVTTPGSILGSTVAKAVGSDIDFILSADQIEAYVGAVADALFNRLILAGGEGLRGVSTAKAPRGGSVPQTVTGNCAGLSGAARQNCLNYIRTNDNSFNLARSKFIDQINNVIIPRQSAAALINDSVSKEQLLINKLNELNNCSPRIALQDEIAKEQTIIDRLTEDLRQNQVLIDEAQAMLSQIRQVPQGDWASLTTIYGNASEKLNPQATSDVLANAQEENDAIKEKVSKRIAELEIQIRICRNIP